MKNVPGKKTWLLLSAIVIGGLVAGLWTTASRRLPKLSSLFSKTTVDPVVYTVKKAPFAVVVPAMGELEAASSISISVPNVRTGGLKIFGIIKDGSLVKKGDTLVEFDASELIQQLQETDNNLVAALRQLEASVFRGSSETGNILADRQIAELEQDKAHTQAPRDQTIFTRNQIIEGELNIDLTNTKVREWTGKTDTRKNINIASERILVIERKQQENKKDMLQQSLGSLKILAPEDGLALLSKDDMGKPTTIGETRWPGYTLMTIPNVSAIKARVQTLETDAGNLKVGQTARITVDSHPATAFDAQIERIDTLARQPDRDSPVKYFEVILKVDGSGGEILKPGKIVHAKITTSSYDEAIAVPRVALVEESLKHYVWALPSGGGGEPQKREVEIGTGDSARVVIKSGLREGDSILLNPPQPADDAKDGARPKTTRKSSVGSDS
jgi:HlyD family secretion protein